MYWRPEQIEFKKDLEKHKNLSDNEKAIFKELLNCQMAWAPDTFHFFDYHSLVQPNPDYKLDTVEMFDKIRDFTKSNKEPFEVKWPEEEITKAHIRCAVQLVDADIRIEKIKDRYDSFK